MSRFDDQVIALAGVAQCARLVDRIAANGQCPAAFMSSSILSLFQFDATDTAGIYQGLSGVRLGLQTLESAMGKSPTPELSNTLKYVFGILHLERKFHADTKMQATVRTRLEHAAFKAEHFSDSPKSLTHNLAGIYQDTLSQLSFRIKVTGNSEYLGQEHYADQIRALLLAGIRSAFLWRQLGGTRWRLVLQRSKIAQRASQLSILHSQ
jgi:high frequency lysogenization protein